MRRANIVNTNVTYPLNVGNKCMKNFKRFTRIHLPRYSFQNIKRIIEITPYKMTTRVRRRIDNINFFVFWNFKGRSKYTKLSLRNDRVFINIPLCINYFIFFRNYRTSDV